MNWTELIKGALRVITPAIVAWLVARNITPDVAGDIVRYGSDLLVAILTFAAAAWSVRKNLVKNQVARVIERDDVKYIELTPELAEVVKNIAPKYANKITVVPAAPPIAP